ncbi:MAG: 2OG-Fe(II) oxygenase [Ferruginibacter sp.]
MQDNFDQLISSYIDTQVGTTENFLSPALSLALTQHLDDLFTREKFHAAGTGKGTIAYDTSFRRDHIYWLDRAHENKSEDAFFDVMDAFVAHLNESCYTGISSYEFHFARYDKDSFYKKHMDQFKSNEQRKYSIIIYLNVDWKTGDGGELCIYHEDRIQEIAPLLGKTVMFKSCDLPHEVRLTHKPRLSITGWLKSN